MSQRPQLYATVDIGTGNVERAEQALRTMFDAAPIASLLLQPAPGASLDAGLAKILTAQAQKRGIAVLIADDARLARMIKADGIHLTWSKDVVGAYRAAREALGAHALIGADAGRSRDDAMQLGEDGADYIAFGIPPHVEDRATAENRQIDLIAWWSEIFQVPCVACDVASVAQARALADSGADFITVGCAVTDPAESIAERIAAYAQALDGAEVSA